MSIATEKNDLVPGDRVARACHQALILIHLVLPVDMQYENSGAGGCRLCWATPTTATAGSPEE